LKVTSELVTSFEICRLHAISSSDDKFCTLPSGLEGPSTLKTEEVCPFETLTIYKTSRGHNPDDHNMNLRRLVKWKISTPINV